MAVKVGIIFAIYNCEDFVDRCLQPWINLRDSHNLILTVTSGRFSTYKELDIPDRNQKTLEKLATKKLDFISATSGENLIDEDSSRNICLNYLKPHGCDIIWLVDGDEFYTEGQIKGVLDYISRYPDIPAFSIYFKNYTIRKPYFLTPWSRPTLYRNTVHSGIRRFYFDSFFVYEEDEDLGINHVEKMQIPKNVAFIEHHSWTPRQATFDKIKYQNIRYSDWYDSDGTKYIHEPRARCQYDEIDGNLYFNMDFARLREVEIPSLHEYPTDTVLSGFWTNYVRSQNKIEVRSDYNMEGFIMHVKDLRDGRLYDVYEVSINKDYLFWYIPNVTDEVLNQEEFLGYRIELFKDNVLVHIENIVTRIGIPA